MDKPSILDPKFKYVSAAATDIRKTFARIERENKAAALRAQRRPDPPANVVVIAKKKG